MLEASAVAVAIGPARLLDAVSLCIAPGEVVAIIGPNGAGKSTLLRVLCGDLMPEDGEVRLLGRPLPTWPVQEQARRRAVLPQQSTLAFAFTAREVVLLGRAPHSGGAAGPRDRAIADAALDVVDAAHLADRWYTTLSGGEQQRVHLARVLAQIWEPIDGQPRFLLLDEPTNSLDLAHQHCTLALARQWSRQGVGVALVLHDLNLAAQYADRLALLHNGRVVAAGTPADVLTPPQIAAVFGLPVQVLAHPSLPGPLVVATPNGPAPHMPTPAPQWRAMH
jgi:iron complex transport system ATP-binding protein